MALAGFISFPNAVCLVLAGLLLTHLLAPLSQDRDDRPAWPDHPEDSYCCLGPRPRPQPAATCSSPAYIFYACASSRRPTTQASVSADERNHTEEVENESENRTEEEVRTLGADDEEKEQDSIEECREEQVKEERTSLLVDTIVVGLLACSAFVSLREWYAGHRRAAAAQGPGVEVASGWGDEGVDRLGVSGRRISLAELTFNRHVRRGESHARHWSSTPSGPRGLPLVRRSSFPAQLPETPAVRTRPAPRRQHSCPGHALPQPQSQSQPPSRRRLSVDLDDDASSDRRRVRIIRRH